jgi:hypothetical protein
MRHVLFVMSSISFTFTPESSDAERLGTLRKIQSWAEVAAVGLIKPDAKSPEGRRMAALMLVPSSAPEKIINLLRVLPAVQQTSIPAVRGLIEPVAQSESYEAPK